MQNEPSHHTRTSLDLKSLLFGLGSGIVATLIFATYKQREFDRLIDKSRRIANSAGDLAEHVKDDAHQMTSNMAHAAHDGVRSAGKASKDAIDAVRTTLAS